MLSASLISDLVKLALAEDIGSGDITAQLIPSEKIAQARVITRESIMVCGEAFVREVFQQVDSNIRVDFKVYDGEQASPNQTLFEATGPARALLTAERTALNFLQMLSATATITHQYVKALNGTHTKLLDTRKTIPLFRLAQKYAVQCGGGQNHRIGLYDAFLIKENHIMACGSIHKAIETAHKIAPGKPVEVEVETLDQLQEAIDAKADIIMLDNFDLEHLYQAVALNQKRVILEVSGNVSLGNIHQIAQTGVDFISVGSLTKHIHAADLSMRFI
jgi:nicotinate-nucleotide pyrophosphorylase (carboxylating)